MLSPSTKDEATSKAFYNLQKAVKGNQKHNNDDKFLPSSLSKMTVEEMEREIAMVSYYRVKAKNLLEAAITCRDNYNDDIPKDINDLLAFRGKSAETTIKPVDCTEGLGLLC